MTELGVYAGPAGTGVSGAQAFATATGCPVTRRTDFLPSGTRAGLRGAIAYALDAHTAGPAMTLDLAVPLLVTADRQAGVTLADVAAGAYDDVFRELADQLAAHPRDPIALRPGHEFNGNWYDWSTCKASTDPAAAAAAYVGAWRRLHDIVTATPGTEHVTWVWCVANGRISSCPAPEAAYPGDEYVDVVGVDFYDYSWRYARDGQGKAVRDTVWGELTAGDLVTADYGLDYWAGFAGSHGKPLALPEWGPGIKRDGKAGGDSADFVHRVLTWAQLADVAWLSYFEAAGSGVEHRIAPDESALPAAREAFRQRMSAWTSTPAAGGRVQRWAAA